MFQLVPITIGMLSRDNQPLWPCFRFRCGTMSCAITWVVSARWIRSSLGHTLPLGPPNKPKRRSELRVAGAFKISRIAQDLTQNATEEERNHANGQIRWCHDYERLTGYGWLMAEQVTVTSWLPVAIPSASCLTVMCLWNEHHQIAWAELYFSWSAFRC